MAFIPLNVTLIVPETNQSCRLFHPCSRKVWRPCEAFDWQVSSYNDQNQIATQKRLAMTDGFIIARSEATWQSAVLSLIVPASPPSTSPDRRSQKSNRDKPIRTAGACSRRSFLISPINRMGQIPSVQKCSP
jgi:hypothetical protein